MQSRTAQYVEQKHQRYKIQSWTVERPGLQWCIYIIYTQASLACYTLLAACHNNCTGARHKAIPWPPCNYCIGQKVEDNTLDYACTYYEEHRNDMRRNLCG